mmetsp:Transcript_43113/g.107971  ORF Transcript_43113/g.107971 Transcript_43113/m.107971 type:complete len:236 (+) Transcript_43113:107-814(+)
MGACGCEPHSKLPAFQATSTICRYEKAPAHTRKEDGGGMRLCAPITQPATHPAQHVPRPAPRVEGMCIACCWRHPPYSAAELPRVGRRVCYLRDRFDAGEAPVSIASAARFASPWPAPTAGDLLSNAAPSALTGATTAASCATCLRSTLAMMLSIFMACSTSSWLSGRCFTTSGPGSSTAAGTSAPPSLLLTCMRGSRCCFILVRACRMFHLQRFILEDSTWCSVGAWYTTPSRM